MEDFPAFVLTLPRGRSGVEIGRLCMSFLMRKQFGSTPANPCPCYYPGRRLP